MHECIIEIITQWQMAAQISISGIPVVEASLTLSHLISGSKSETTLQLPSLHCYRQVLPE